MKPTNNFRWLKKTFTNKFDPFYYAVDNTGTRIVEQKHHTLVLQQFWKHELIDGWAKAEYDTNLNDYGKWIDVPVIEEEY